MGCKVDGGSGFRGYAFLHKVALTNDKVDTGYHGYVMDMSLVLVRLCQLNESYFDLKAKMNLQMDEKRKGKLISFSVAWREEEPDRVGH